MKKFSKTIAMFTLSFLALAFNKEDMQETETPQEQKPISIDLSKYDGLSVEKNVLSFESIDYYTSIVSDESDEHGTDELIDYLNQSGFANYGKKFGDKSEYDEPFMDAIMNEDKVVKIGEWFIYIDMSTETVLAISDEEENAYQALLQQSSRAIKIFNTGDDVLDHLANNTTPQDHGCGGIGGGIYPSPTLKYGDIDFYAFVKFFKAGVYFRLTGGYKSNAVAYTYFSKYLEIKGPQAWCQRRPCGASKIKTRSAGTISAGYNNQYTIELYEGVRNLNGYYFYVRAKWPGLTTGWAGRNINSPY